MYPRDDVICQQVGYIFVANKHGLPNSLLLIFICHVSSQRPWRLLAVMTLEFCCPAHVLLKQISPYLIKVDVILNVFETGV